MDVDGDARLARACFDALQHVTDKLLACVAQTQLAAAWVGHCIVALATTFDNAVLGHLTARVVFFTEV